MAYKFESEILEFLAASKPDDWFAPREVVDGVAKKLPFAKFPPSGGSTTQVYTALYRLARNRVVEVKDKFSHWKGMRPPKVYRITRFRGKD